MEDNHNHPYEHPWKNYGTKIYVGDGALVRDHVGTIHSPINCERTVLSVNLLAWIPVETLKRLAKGESRIALGSDGEQVVIPWAREPKPGHLDLDDIQIT
jgi:hypothetical protein